MPARSPAFLQAIVGQSFDGISLADMDGHYVFANDRFCAMSGYGADELLAMTIHDLLPAEQSTELLPKAAEGRAGTLESVVIRKDGTRLPVELSCSRIRVEDRDFVLNIVRDISERLQARESLKHQHERLEVLLQASRDINAELDVTAVLRHLVEAALRLTGAQSGAAGLMVGGELYFGEYYRGDEVIPVDFRFSPGHGVPGWVMENRRPYLSNDAANDSQVSQEVRTLLNFSNLLAIPIINRHGELLGCFNIVDNPDGFDESDVSLLEGLSAHAAVALENAQVLKDRQQAFRALELSEQKYRTLIENASDAIFLASAETGILFDANRQAERLMGLPREKIVGMHQSALHPPEEEGRYREYFRRYVEEGGGIIAEDMFVQCSDGPRIPVEISAGIIDIGGRGIVQSVFRDISERKRAEEELKQLNRTLKLISECNQILVHAQDEEELLDDICRQIVELGGYRMAWVGMVFRNEARSIEPVAQAGFEDGYLQSISITWREDDVSGSGPGGQAVRAGHPVICQDIEHDPQFAPWREHARERGYGSAAAFPLKIGEEVIGLLNLYDTRPGAFHDEEVSLFQELAADVAYGLDALRHKEAKERLEAQLLQSQKMEAIGTLAGGIAHDFNNILTGMMGNLYLVKRASADRPDVLERVKRVEAQGRRAAETVAQLLTFARKRHVHMQPLSLASLIKEHMKLYRASIPENIELHTSVGEGEWMLNGDATQLQQMLLNLLANARHAVEERDAPVIEVRLERLDADEEPFLRHAGLEGEHFIHLVVSDNGCGIAKAHMDKLFEPFFTTKAAGKGTGLGLAMVYGIVQSHGGAVEVESREDEGTSVHLYFPLAASRNHARVEEAGEMEVGHGETVLLVDDDHDVRQTVEEVLLSLGYHVLVASDGQEGWETFEAHRGEVKLAVLDVVMPRMSGPKLAQKMREVQPELPILFQSGYGEEDMLREIEQMDKSRFLAKPIDVIAFSRNVRQLLHKPG